MKKKIKKALSLLCVSVMVLTSFTSTGAVENIASEINSASETTVVEEITEPTTETTPIAEATEALDPIPATEPATAPIVKREKKSLYSTGADIDVKSTGATSASGLALGDPQTLTSANGDLDYATDVNGNKVALTVVKTRYATTNASKYTYQGTDSKGNAITLGKPYKVVITCDNGAGDGSKLTATWTVDESTITSTRTEADGTGTLTISSGVTTAANKTTRDWYTGGLDYTPWGVALTNSKITNVEIGYAIRTIGKNSFKYLTALKTLTFKKNSNDISYVKTIDEYAFYGCDALTSLTLNGTKLVTIAGHAFQNCDVLKTVTVNEESLTSIGDYAFYGNPKLTTLTLTANSLKTLGTSVFQNNPALVTATFNTDALTTLPEKAFYGSFTTATSATSMIILNAVSLKTIGTSAFQNCTALEVVRFRDAPIVTIGSQAFRGCTSLERTSATDSNSLGKIPDGSTTDTLSNILTLPRTVKTIEDYAFAGCSKIEVVSYILVERGELQTINNSAFRNMSNLQVINLPNSLQTIEASAFQVMASIVPKPKRALCLSSGTETNTLTGVSQVSQLAKIGSSAFTNDLSDENKANGTIPNGLRIYDRATGETLTKDTVFVFQSLTQIDFGAFANNARFVGQLLFKQQVSIYGQVFRNTNLTNIYCQYDGEATWNKADSTVNSSRIGSTDVYTYGTDSNPRNFAYTTDETITLDGVTYQSLYHILTNNIKYWGVQVNGVGNKDVLYNEWVAEAMKSTAWSNGDINVPYQALGMFNGTADNEQGPDINPVTGSDTSSFLQTEVEWITPNETAKETVTFGYKNPTCVDYIFVVDTSSSMDVATNSSGKTIDGSRNVSKLMTAFSQVYSISERVLSSKEDNSYVNNTVSIITFNDNGINGLKNSSKYLGTTDEDVDAGTYGGLRTQEEVYNALFENEDGYTSSGTTNWSSGLSRAYKMVEGIRKYNETAGIENQQVVIFLTDGSPTYANGSADAGAGDFSPIYTENNGLTAITGGSVTKNNVANQVNGVDWAKAIKGSTSSSFSVRHYENSYYDPSTDTLNSTTQTVKGLDVEIFGILVGSANNDKKANLNKVTSPPDKEVPTTKAKLTDLLAQLGLSYTVDNALQLMSGKIKIGDIRYDSKTFTSDDGDLSALAKNLVFVISSLTSEDYVVVIPLDNNFKLSTNKITVSILDENENVTQSRSFNLTSDWHYNLKNHANLGRIRYDETNNRIIWDLSDYLQDGGTTSSSFVTYQLSFDMDLQDETTLTRGVSSENPYYSVSTNNPDTSLNTFDFGDYSFINGMEQSFQKFSSAYIDYNQYVGAYVYINSAVSLDSDPTQTADGNFLMNYSDALYLPVDVGGLNLYKKTDDDVALTGAEFQVYDINGNLMSFYKNSRNTTQYSYYDTTFFTTRTYQGQYLYYSSNVTDSNGDAAMFTEIVPAGTSALASIVELPPGTYYLYESTFPTDDLNEYTLSDLDIDQLEIITCADGVERQCFKVVVSSDTTVSTTVHNTAIATSGRIEGYKVDQSGNYLAGATIGLYDSYPSSSTAVLLDTYITKADGKYIFNVDSAGTYYIREISAPEGYLLTTSTYSVTFTEDNLGGVQTVSSNIVNHKYVKIIVHVDGSDYVKESYGYTLTANNNSSVNYTGVTDGEGTYTFHVPHRNINGAPYQFAIQQTSAPNDYYLPPEYSMNGFDDTVANTGKFTIGTVASGTEVHVYVYNPSVKVTVNNYDGNDRTTPLLSDFKLNDVAYSTDENGSFTANEWFGYGDNTLVQTKVPTGYNLLAEPVTVNVSNDNIELAQDENGQRYYKRIETVYNVPSIVFPLTGGNGRQMFNTVAVTLLSLATIMAFVYLRQKSKMKEFKKEG